jgi:hypothetical protein
MAEHVGSLIWVLLWVFIGVRRIYGGLPEVRARIRAHSSTPEDLARLKKHILSGWGFIIIGVATGGMDAARLFTD